MIYLPYAVMLLLFGFIVYLAIWDFITERTARNRLEEVEKELREALRDWHLDQPRPQDSRRTLYPRRVDARDNWRTN